ncbi:MAG TPA: NAD(P)-binding domain-containing protein [Candidatus Limnocylindrales bacterium]
MRIAILGAGNVGGGLGTAFARTGHEVVFGVRDPASAKTLAALAAAPGARATTPADAVEGAEVVVFALRWDAVPDMLDQMPSLDGRIVIDAMNRFGGDPARSTTQDLADLLPGVRLAKAFNTIGFENFTTARGRRTPAAMFVAGDDPDAKTTAMVLAGEIGFEPEDAGPITNAKGLEEMARVWQALASTHGRGVGWAVSTD